MLILSADTSGKHGSIALVREHSGSLETLDVVPLEGGTFSAELIPQIASLLSQHKLAKHDLDAFIVVSGPGSFTGLRVGLAAVKGLAEVLQKPVVAVSLLEVLVRTCGEQGPVTALLDAGRGEVYAGNYEVSGSSVTVNSESLLLLEKLTPGAGIIITSDHAIVSALAERGLPAKLVPRPRSDVVAKIGWPKLLAGEITSTEALEANYIRRSDAELFVRKN